MVCTRCSGSGFLNVDQLPEGVEGVDEILLWLRRERTIYDVAICDCCGDGEAWHGESGQHYMDDDPQGPDGPYAYNGGLCECN